MKRLLLPALLLWASLCSTLPAHGWGFWGHRHINRYAAFGLPPALLALYKPHLNYLSEHAVDPDMRRYLVPSEGAHHYIDIDRYGSWPYPALPRRWDSAVAKFGLDTLQANGVVPWWVVTVQRRLTEAFKAGDKERILKLSAELGHYIADAHVPLHASSNHNGQLTGQTGIHGLWESRIPELLAEPEWRFAAGRAVYIERPLDFIWDRVLESAAAADTVLAAERLLAAQFPPGQRWGFAERKGRLERQFSAEYATAFNRALGGMVERRMCAAIWAVSCFWYTAWVDAGQPDAAALAKKPLTETDRQEMEKLQAAWRRGVWQGRSED
ncbi:MAG: S1/P1 Nuclease [Chitinophagaceae bacterium]|nr:MAG: S1/P1 Nuclease [Chitinophagaceae bacterium]